MFTKKELSMLDDISLTVDYNNKCYRWIDNILHLEFSGRLVFGFGRVVAIMPERGSVPSALKSFFEDRGFYIVKEEPAKHFGKCSRTRVWKECDMYDFTIYADKVETCYMQGVLYRDDMLNIVDFSGAFTMPLSLKCLLENMNQRVRLLPRRNYCNL